jgi:hypothetical protein
MSKFRHGHPELDLRSKLEVYSLSSALCSFPKPAFILSFIRLDTDPNTPTRRRHVAVPDAVSTASPSISRHNPAKT